MKEHFGWKVYRNIPRVKKSIILEFTSIPTTIISDCMNRSGVMSSNIKPLTHNVHVVGTAVTAECMPGNNLMTHQVLYVAQEGDVIVIDGKGEQQRSIWGGIQTRVALDRRIAAVVIDGAVRDVKEIRASGLAVFCLAVTPAGPFKDLGGNINVPIRCGGLVVHPGDLIVGDDDGLVVVPQQKVEDILNKSKERLKMEEQWLKDLQKGKTTLEILELDQKIEALGVEFKN